MSDRDRSVNPEPQDDNDDAVFVARIAASLKAAESLDDTFESRLSAAIRRDTPPPRTAARGWWTRQRTISISPLVGLALAASVAAVVAAGTLTVDSARRSLLASGGTLAARDTDVVHVVRFVFLDSSARSVALVGDFNGWSHTATDLERGTNGAWSISIPLPPGRHEYAFIVDGKRWVADPFASTIHDDFGTESSVIQLDDVRTSTTT